MLATIMAATAAKPAHKIERILEFAGLGPVDAKGIDAAGGVIRGVKILGLSSRNGRQYTQEAVKQAAALYEGAKVNLNHPKGNPGGPREYQDRLGAIRNVTVKEDGLHGDLHFNPKHAIAEQLAWDAANSPENVGLSHNIEGRTSLKGNQQFVEAITRVHSVDLVADPATTKSLFESLNMDGVPAVDSQPADNTPADPADALSASFKKQINDILDGDGDAKSKVKQIAEIIKKQEKIMGMLDTGTGKGDDDSAEGNTEGLANSIKTLREQLDRMTAEKTAAEIDRAITEELSTANLPSYLVTDVFKGQLRGAKDKAARSALLEDRKAIAKTAGRGPSKPVSRDGHMTEQVGGAAAPAGDAKAFASAILR